MPAYPKVAHIHPRSFHLGTRVTFDIFGENYDTLPAAFTVSVDDPAGVRHWTFVDAVTDGRSRIKARFDLAAGHPVHGGGDVNVTVSDGLNKATAPFPVSYV